MGGKSSANGAYTLSVIPWHHVYNTLSVIPWYHVYNTLSVIPWYHVHNTLSVIPWHHVYKMHTRRAATAVAEDSDNDPTVVGDSEHQ